MAVRLLIPVLNNNSGICQTTLYSEIINGQQTFQCSPYVLGANQTEVYVNGQYQYLDIDFVELNSTEIELLEACEVGDIVEIKVRR